MALYGDPNVFSLVKRRAVSGETVMFTARFTTAGASQPVVDVNKTRGPTKIERTATGVTVITLPMALRNAIVLTSDAGGTTAQESAGDMLEGSNVVIITTVTAGGAVAADSTGKAITVVIIGTAH